MNTNQGPRDTEERTAKSALFSLHNGSLPGMRAQLLPLHSALSASCEGVQHPAQISNLFYSGNLLQSLKRGRHWESSIYPTCLQCLSWRNKICLCKVFFSHSLHEALNKSGFRLKIFQSKSATAKCIVDIYFRGFCCCFCVCLCLGLFFFNPCHNKSPNMAEEYCKA